MANIFKRDLKDLAKTSLKRTCMLKPLTAEHQTIQLDVGKNFVGRCKETGIRDARCSKQQLELRVDLNACKVKLKVLGVNPCGLNGLMTMQNTECDVEHGDILEIVYGRHAYEVIFKPPPEGLPNKNAEGSVQSQARWESVENGNMMVFTSGGVEATVKIAGYDIDGTIIRTKSGNVFPKNPDDWQLNYKEVSEKLKRLHADGYKICFFTNQGGISKGKVNLDEFKTKICAIVQRVGVPVQVFIAITDGIYRKPAPGMWLYLKENMNQGVAIKLEKCFFVGDAAGRPEVGTGAIKRKKDHSLVDRLFASNIGVSFYTPEEHFLGKKTEPWNKPAFEPSEVDNNLPLLEPQGARLIADGCEMILLVGLPGSGKSHFANQHLKPHGYRILNADTLGSTQSCLKGCLQAIRAGQHCVVDNTNVDIDSRKKFIDIAKSHQIICRCFVMNISYAQVKHNIAFRNLIDTNHSKINDMVFNTIKKKYTEPTTEEGFAEIVRVNFKQQFSNEKHANLYKLYLVEK